MSVSDPITESIPAESSLDQARSLIDSSDFSAVIKRLVKIDKWPLSQAKEACAQYRNFLFLKKKYGHAYELPPSYDIDEVWHAHVLHTRDYMDFCSSVFGAFLHHNPHTDDADPESMGKLVKLFESQTQKLYQLEFGTPIYAVRISVKRLFIILFNRLFKVAK